ncbi:dihydrolipoyl dehydrogenase family protein [Sphingosinicella humi]|uniref:NAD(P)/FAD-dependent oxidoreductase n=1 Tax=Allosphingosinicella humi TaxID=2068657 RepID=A0A2U2J0Z9_9SPHN|nr:NAD(P)/FAD-dependent oxidoreductase [Sphingosinicella humi]PWG01961.1 NAD(P)/FAD-dependent oxidoreductase [Sphingosinicella humi]
MEQTYDLIVIGTGTAAMVAATRMRDAGWTVAIIDEKPFGGTCALRGCDPKKMLVAGAEVIDSSRRLHGRGIIEPAEINWRDLIAFKRTFTDAIPAKHEQRYQEKGIVTFHGQAYFTGPNSISIAEEPLHGRHILIAAGAEPVRLGIPGEEHLIDHEDFLAMDSLPARVLLVGGGYIAAEFSHVAVRAGAKVTILQRSHRLLPQFEPELVGWLMEAFERSGVDVRTGTTAIGIEKTGEAFTVHASAEDGSRMFVADLVVHAAGRRPALDRLDLPTGDIASERGRLQLNEHLQSISNPAVYAAGDAAQMGPPLTPVSSHDAKVVAANLIKGNHARPDYRGVPSVAFTLPPIAAVGMSEEAARASGCRFRVKSERASHWYTARRVAEPVYGYKTLVEEDTDRILGAHLVGPHADEVINLFGLAIRHGLTAGDLKTTMFAYPTGASDIGYML